MFLGADQDARAVRHEDEISPFDRFFERRRAHDRSPKHGAAFKLPTGKRRNLGIRICRRRTHHRHSVTSPLLLLCAFAPLREIFLVSRKGAKRSEERRVGKEWVSKLRSRG